MHAATFAQVEEMFWNAGKIAPDYWLPEGESGVVFYHEGRELAEWDMLTQTLIIK